MIHTRFATYDAKAETYHLPFYARNSAVAIRSFEEAANQEGHDFMRFAADYTLFELGTFDDESGVSSEHKAHINLGNALQFVRSEPAAAQQAEPVLREVEAG